jgi:hypothetical protein
LVAALLHVAEVGPVQMPDEQRLVALHHPQPVDCVQPRQSVLLLHWSLPGAGWVGCEALQVAALQIQLEQVDPCGPSQLP